MFCSKMIPLLTFLIIACSSNPKQNTHAPVKPTIKANSFSTISSKEKEYYRNAITPLYESLLVKKGFNGGILLAKNGEVVFENYRGMVNLKTKEPITSSTPFHIASVSKTFTSALILKLMEEGKLVLEDPVEKYLLCFPYKNITIKDLLTHRSGLPKYDHFMSGTRTEVKMVKNKKGKMVKKIYTSKVPLSFSGLALNKDVLQYMITYHPQLEATPNRKYSYCNTNYVMLALIVEKITNMSFPDYLESSVFRPLGMKNSFVFSIKDTSNYIPSYNYNNVPFKLEKLDCIYGDKNVYSTVTDLLQWDRALYLGQFLKPETLELAFQPYSNEKRGEKNYGMGWHLLIKSTEPTIVYHNGWWHGNNAVFKRMVSDSATVIILGNKFNKNIWTAGKMSSVFTGHMDTTTLEQ